MPGPVGKEKQFGLPDDFSKIDVTRCFLSHSTDLKENQSPLSPPLCLVYGCPLF